MKKSILIFVVLATVTVGSSVFSQIANEPVALGLPGDNLNLYAVLDVFQKSRTLEDFEKAINERETNINNLDLNNDNRIDYINLVSFREGNSHFIVLRVAINSNESQDVAVIEVDKNNAGKIGVQIIGDEELYGRDYIVEPSDLGTPNPGYNGERAVIINGNGGFYVNDWPIMFHLFSPAFSFYTSPWRWGYYPRYWYPWSPISYYDYWGFHNHYYNTNYYRRSGYVRNRDHYSYYARRRNSSPYVIQNRRSGSYNRTYEGRDFRRLNAPGGIRSPWTRQTAPSQRQRTSPTRQAFPSTRQTAPSQKQGTSPTRQAFPSTRQTAPPQRQTVPSSRQAAPSTRQTAPPPQRQTVPLTRPTAPSQKQGTSPTRQAFPSTRQTAPPQK